MIPNSFWKFDEVSNLCGECKHYRKIAPSEWKGKPLFLHVCLGNDQVIESMIINCDYYVKKLLTNRKEIIIYAYDFLP